MTTIAGFTNGRSHALAADGRLCFGSMVGNDRMVKLFSLPNGHIVAMTGMAKAKLAFSMIEFDAVSNAQDFATGIEASMREIGFTPDDDEDGGPVRYVFGALYMSDEGIWHISPDMYAMAVTSCSSNGSGSELSLGAMTAIACAGGSPIEIVSRSIVIAAHFDIYTGPNIMLAARGETHLDPVWLDEFDDDSQETD